ncbi:MULTISPECIES: hypothetical protein [unclassified Brevundimonas]|uniref:hypothetical protein n=1 Tax=unclassified Brevundimonas TaxID=2622653 RepID=UPI0025C20D3B|nr:MULTISPECIES: hypothetical protein [unclassified Brevundimonas]
MTETKEKKTEAKAAPAKEFAPSGAPIQPMQVDPNEPAVDADPREGTSEEQNRIDFNDPTLSGAEAVAKNLGLKVESKD